MEEAKREILEQQVEANTPPPGAADATAVRECGACTACCTVHGVRELEKEPHRRCDHLTENGCGIYDQRPVSCRVYVCGWLAGSYGKGNAHTMRPDRLGVIVDRPQALDGRLVAREVWRGAFDRPAVKNLLGLLFRNGFSVQVVGFAGRKLPVTTVVPIVGAQQERSP